MTPLAMTSAGQKVAAARTGARTATSRAGAARVRASAAAAPRMARAAAAPRPVRAPAPRAPRRVSGPVRTRRPAAQLPLQRRLALGALEFVRSLPDHRLIDRLVRGRAWIPVLGVLLAGIVATQVEVLKLGASMGRWMERSSALSSHNQALQAKVAALSDDQRIERLAAHMGMVMPAPTAIKFLPHRPAGGLRAAVSRIQTPDPTQFLYTLEADAALTSTGPPPTIAPATPTTTGSTTDATTSASGATTAGTVTPTGATSAVVTPPGTTSQSTGG